MPYDMAYWIMYVIYPSVTVQMYCTLSVTLYKIDFKEPSFGFRNTEPKRELY